MLQSRETFRAFTTPAAIAAAVVFLVAMPRIVPADLADDILRATGIKGGLAVHVGCGDGRLTAALRANDSYIVHGLDSDPADVQAARRYIRSLNLYGNVSVALLRGNDLPYIDNLVNLLVVQDRGGITDREIMRVLAPDGIAYIRQGDGWDKRTKQRPLQIDQWTHYLHDASNNAVARDEIVGPPHHFQWVATPTYLRHHGRLASISAVVSTNRRIFYIADEAPAASVYLTPHWRLVARDAFSGVLLWKRSISSWHRHLHGFRQGPPHIARRLVAVADSVYVTLGMGEPVTRIDAATGQTLRAYENTTGAEEIVYSDGTLFVVGRQPESEDANLTYIAAIDAATGNLVWRKDDGDASEVMRTTLAVSNGRACFLSNGAVVCLDAKTGDTLWRTNRAVADQRAPWSAPTLVIHDGVVLCADRAAGTTKPDRGGWNNPYLAGAEGKLSALSAEDGTELWHCQCAETFHAPVDVFVIDGVVWAGHSRMREAPDYTIGRDLHTGEIVKRIDTSKAFPAVREEMSHHRCHRDKATTQGIVVGRIGVEFINVHSDRILRHHWVRGSCQYGVVPCNGLLYAPPHACACYIRAKINGFFALAPRRGDEPLAPVTARPSQLEPGPAYDQFAEASTDEGAPDDWPTYRHDNERSGHTPAFEPADSGRPWTNGLGGKLSAPVMAGGTLFVAKVNEGTVYALDAETGETLWHYTAGGRVNSPPTIYRGRALFGSADGYVYCLRARDGRLIWRFRAAPRDRRAVDCDRVESIWPVNGTVLVEDGVAYCAAGRSSYLDGGLYLYRLDVDTGRALSVRNLYSPDPQTGEQPEADVQGFEMPGALPDVMSKSDDLLFMRHSAFDPDTLESREPADHLFCPTGFLDDTWWHRTYWVYGTMFYSGYKEWRLAHKQVPAGRMLCFDDSAIYGLTRPGLNPNKHILFSAPNREYDEKPWGSGHRAIPQYNQLLETFNWHDTDLAVIPRAMVLAGNELYVAGPPEGAMHWEHLYSGQHGALLCVYSTDGGKLREHMLQAPPVFDGMAAARGHLYVSTIDGNVICLPQAGRSLPTAATDQPPAGAGPQVSEPGLVAYWRFDIGKGMRAADSSGNNHTARVHGQWTEGRAGGAIDTNGMPGAITIDDCDDIRFGTSDFSLVFWLKPRQLGRRVMGKENFPQNWWVINLLDSGKLELVLGQSREGNRTARPTSKTPLPVNEWTHVAFVVDRENREARCYINGSLDSTTSIPEKLSGSLDVKGEDLKIPSSYQPLSCLIDELKIYRRAISADDVKANYRAPQGSPEEEQGE